MLQGIRGRLAASTAVAVLLLAPAAATAEIFVIQEGEDSSPYRFLPSLVRGNRDTSFAFTGVDQNGQPHDFRSFIRFDLGPEILGPDEQVIEAVAWVFYGFDFTAFGDATALPGEVHCHEVLDPWNEGSLTWNNQPAFGPALDVHPDINGLGLVWCDVTELVQDWLTGAAPNYGVVLTNPTERLIGMYSLEATEFEGVEVHPNQRPSLVIETGASGIEDLDADLVPDAEDNCPLVPNAPQDDFEVDGVGDACDLCPVIFDPEQGDVDGNGRGDRCDRQGADLNGDLRVDFDDRTLLEATLGSVEGDPSYDPALDFDGDGAIGQSDWDLWLPLYDEFRTRSACGLVGLEAMLLAGAVAFLRRRARRR